LSETRHEVDKHGRHVEAPSVLAGRVVTWKDVVVVVESLTHGADRHEDVLRGVDALIVRLVAPHVRGAVDEPRAVESQRVAEHAADKVRQP